MQHSDIIPPRSRPAIEKLSCGILSEYQPSVLSGEKSFDVEDFIEFELEGITGITFEITDELPMGVLGLTDPIRKKLWVPNFLSDDNTLQGIRRYRSTLAHEIGHCLLHAKYIREAGKEQVFSQKQSENYTTFYRQIDVPPYRDPEWQAWEAAGSLLMPKSAVVGLLNNGATRRDLIEHFNLNGAFVDSRLKKLKIN